MKDYMYVQHLEENFSTSQYVSRQLTSITQILITS